MSSVLQNRLKTARRSLAHQASRLKKRKKPSRKSTLCSIADPATMLLKAALDQPAIEHAIQPIRVLETQTSIYECESEGELPPFHQKGTDLEEKLQELQTCEIMIQSNGCELVELISRDMGSGMISKATVDRLMLFKLTANAMVEASLGFTTEDDEFFDAIEGPSLEDSPPDSSASSPTDSGRSITSRVMTPMIPSERRTRVPQRPSNSINYLSLMKNCIGKDLSKISMPVDFNEPISVLQRQTEDLEYSSLLDRAVEEKNDPEKRLALVTVFAISAYSTVGKRTAKPFNPLLGETFDFDRRSDLGWRSVAEQVSHHPPTCALFAESLRGWNLNQSYTYTSKVKGRSLCVMPIGATYIRFEDNEDLFTFEKVSTATRMTNIMTGNLQTDNYGDLCVKNLRTGAKCIIKFHEQKYFSKEDPRKVSGAVLDPSGVAKYRIEGSWDLQTTVFKIDLEENIIEEEVLWKVNPLPKDSEKMHNFTKLAIELNELEDGLPPTDSRLRPDQRLMEEGKWQVANEVKQKLEEAQRERRQKREEQNIEYQPLWFHRKDLSKMIDQNDVYDFHSDYWLHRESRDFHLCPDIFSLD
ncbi:hypothetical protein FO519_004613 [Halicephalobus sp. NKZ332]|nr:hypothetical protein FO519_004613 [Halicephalobus sp. NKZ332]